MFVLAAKSTMVRYARAWLVAAVLCIAGFAVSAQPAPTRVALVIGIGGYGQGTSTAASQGALPGALNDAGLAAEALRSIGFDVTEGADLKQADLLTEFKNFAARVEAGGPNTIAVFYFSGYGFSFEKDNLLVAGGALLEGDTDIALDTVRLAEVLQPLAALPARAKIIMVDAARALPFALKDVKVAPGLQAVDAPPNTLISFSASPGVLSADSAGAYGAYALAVAEMIRTNGLDLADVFARVRLRTHQVTQGNQTSWDVSAIAGGVTLAASEAAPRSALHPVHPMNSLSPDDAYALAIEQDTLAGYSEFVRTFPSNAYTPRIAAMLRARQDALTWQRALENNSPQAYWTYQRRYPEGIYTPDAERRLTRWSVALQPPANFDLMTFADIPAPVSREPTGGAEGLPQGPPPPARMIAPRPPLYANLALPSRDGVQRGPRTGRSVLPVPTLPRNITAEAPSAETKPPATKPVVRAAPRPGRPRPVAPRPQQAPAPQSGGFFAPWNPAASVPARPQPPRSLAPPAQQRPAPPRQP